MYRWSCRNAVVDLVWDIVVVLDHRPPFFRILSRCSLLFFRVVLRYVSFFSRFVISFLMSSVSLSNLVLTSPKSLAKNLQSGQHVSIQRLVPKRDRQGGKR